MKEYGLIVIGSGAGMNVVGSALERGLKVAVVEEGPLGGTCLNRGCIPSKVLIHAADVVREAEQASAVGVPCIGASEASNRSRYILSSPILSELWVVPNDKGSPRG